MRVKSQVCWPARNSNGSRRTRTVSRTYRAIFFSFIIHTDLLNRFAPRIYARQRLALDQLAHSDTIYPVFPDSAFTTTEFSFGTPPRTMRRETYDAFGSWRAITALGDYSEEEGDRLAIHFPPGAALVFPALIVRFTFTPIKHGETRYLFQQFYNAAVGRWVNQGFMGDADFSNEPGWAAHQERRWERVESTIAAMSRIGDVFV
ncbi:hypothetical protein DFH09DRAFT_918584 [Mycena vulgaris]|nr:hypothetical protein DFH09DRAFT_918584 [Mycena vulgaris]